MRWPPRAPPPLQLGQRENRFGPVDPEAWSVLGKGDDVRAFDQPVERGRDLGGCSQGAGPLVEAKVGSHYERAAPVPARDQLEEDSGEVLLWGTRAVAEFVDDQQVGPAEFIEVFLERIVGQ